MAPFLAAVRAQNSTLDKLVKISLVLAMYMLVWV